ncbi:hypothetical protein AOLI_G00127200 [Acnodon oligacanthus]
MYSYRHNQAQCSFHTRLSTQQSVLGGQRRMTAPEKIHSDVPCRAQRAEIVSSHSCVDAVSQQSEHTLTPPRDTEGQNLLRDSEIKY